MDESFLLLGLQCQILSTNTRKSICNSFMELRRRHRDTREENYKTTIVLVCRDTDYFTRTTLVTRTKITCERTSLQYVFTNVYVSIRLPTIWVMPVAHAHYHPCNEYRTAFSPSPSRIKEAAEASYIFDKYELTFHRVCDRSRVPLSR